MNINILSTNLKMTKNYLFDRSVKSFQVFILEMLLPLC